jgi:cytochrome c-type biogenesis protein CcmH
MKAFLIVVLFANPIFLTSAQKAELRRVEERLRAPCCYTQSIQVHGSEIAGEMRAEVADMVAEGRTEEEIVNHYRSLYGDRILIVPDGVTGKILFGLPVLTSVLGFLVVFLFARKMLRARKGTESIPQKETLPVLNKLLRQQIERDIGEPF